MQVWRIFKKEVGMYAYGIFNTWHNAVMAIPWEVEATYRRFHYPRKQCWADISKQDAITQGVYYNKEFGLDWVVKATILEDYREEEPVAEEYSYNWHDIGDVWILEDQQLYNIKVAGGEIFGRVTYDETAGEFYDDEGNEYPVEEVLEVQRI